MCLFHLLRRSRDQRGRERGGKSLMGPMSRAKNSGIALFSVSLPR